MRPPRQYGPAWIVVELLAWIVFPLGLLWFAFDRGSRWSAMTAEQRVERMLAWFPEDWRTRYGDEFAAFLLDAMADGRDGPGLWLDVAREGVAARLRPTPRAKRTWLATGLWTVGVIALLPLGIVPVVLGIDTSDLSPAITIGAGAALVAAALVLFSGRNPRRRSARAAARR